MAEDKNNKFTIKEVLLEVKSDLKIVLEKQAKQEQLLENYIENNKIRDKRINSHATRLRIIELTIAGIIVIPSVILFLHKLGLLAF